MYSIWFDDKKNENFYSPEQSERILFPLRVVCLPIREHFRLAFGPLCFSSPQSNGRKIYFISARKRQPQTRSSSKRKNQISKALSDAHSRETETLHAFSISYF